MISYYYFEFYRIFKNYRHIILIFLIYQDSVLILHAVANALPQLSGSRAFALFLVEGGAAIIVASTMVPSRMSMPRSARWPLICSKIT